MRKARLIPATVLLALLSFPAVAAAEAIVPPGNSAAAQYTEAFPTAGGDKETEGRKKQPTANDTLGTRNTHRLESKGAEGKAVAEFAAETSPAPAVEESSGGGGGQSSGGGGSTGASSGGNQAGGDSAPGGGGHANANAGADGSVGKAIVVHRTDVPEPSGSSGIGEVLGQATGSSSSGGLGLLLPLIVIGAVAWSLFYLWRQRQGQRTA